ncbi:MAG: DUF6781 family protein [Thiohalomonadales bacterium]
MNDKGEKETQANNPHIHDAIKKAVENGENVREKVRDITIEALCKEHFDKDHIKSVIKSAWDGAKEGAEKQGEQAKQIFSEVMSGLDEALEKYAHASKLAIEETAARVREFTQHDLKRTLDELKGLEAVFLDTMSDAAQSTKKVFADVFTDLLEHAKTSGTEVGRRSLQEFDTLSTKLGKVGKESIDAASDSVTSFGSDVARAASGFLGDLASTLKPEKNNSDKKTADKNSQ